MMEYILAKKILELDIYVLQSILERLKVEEPDAYEMLEELVEET